MEIQEAAALVDSWWNELPSDLLIEIFAWLPVEFLYSYRIICKQWNDLLSSNYFLTKWDEASYFNRKQPRLVLFEGNPKMPCIAFCFYTGTWIKSCFNFSFLTDWIPRTHSRSMPVDICCKHSVGGLILVNQEQFLDRICGRLCNPYTRTFVEIPSPHAWLYTECIIVAENNNQRPESAYKLIAVGNNLPNPNELIGRKTVEIYEPSQKTWNIAGYMPEHLMLESESELVYYNGSFYFSCRMVADEATAGVACFTIPLEGNGSAVVPQPIPMHFTPFPEIVRNWKRLHNQCDLSSPRMITCGSRLLLIAAKRRPRELEIIMWEFINEQGGCDLRANSQSWEWVEIARMPSWLCKEWTKKLWSNYLANFLLDSCVGVGDHVCFIPSPGRVVEVVTYNVIYNTWNWLPRCPIKDPHAANHYKLIAFEPRPHRKIE